MRSDEAYLTYLHVLTKTQTRIGGGDQTWRKSAEHGEGHSSQRCRERHPKSQKCISNIKMTDEENW